MQYGKEPILDEGIEFPGRPARAVPAQLVGEYLNRARWFLFLIALLLVMPLFVAVNLLGASTLDGHAGTLTLGTVWVICGILSHHRPVWGFAIALSFFLFILWSGVHLTLEHWTWKVMMVLVLIMGLILSLLYVKISRRPPAA